MIIYLDTETTGLYPGKICQLSYIMQEDDEITAKNFFFSVDSIDYGALQVHGYTVEDLKKLSNGERFKDHAQEIHDDFILANLIVSHNTAFDFMFLRTEFERAGVSFSLSDWFCTMKGSVGLCQLPREGGGFKYPKLSDLCAHFNITEEEVSKKELELFGDSTDFHDARFDSTAVYLVANAGVIETPDYSKIKRNLNI